MKYKILPPPENTRRKEATAFYHNNKYALAAPKPQIHILGVLF